MSAIYCNDDDDFFSKLLALITLGFFCILASYAYGITAPRTHTVRQAVTAEADMEPLAVTVRVASVKLWKRSAAGKDSALARKQAEAYAAVYGITAENVNSYKEWW